MAATKTPKKQRWSVEDVEHVQQRQAMSQALLNLGLGDRMDAGDTPTPPKRARRAKTPEPNGASDTPAPAKKKRRGVSTAPIFQSLRQAAGMCTWTQDSLAINIVGGRVLTYNELFSILQFRKHESFRYKTLCRDVVEKCLAVPEHTVGPRPFFNGPTRLVIVREAAKEMDRDALAIVFKYFLDAFKAQGVIDDDNPNIIVDIQTHQRVGPPRLAMRLERLTDWVAPAVPQWSEWTASAVRTRSVSKKKARD